MSLAFVNRDAELNELQAAAARGGLLVIYGRRRVGKTRLLVEWLRRANGWYSQAIEGPVDLQVQQTFQDLRERLETSLVPKSWGELLELLAAKAPVGFVHRRVSVSGHDGSHAAEPTAKVARSRAAGGLHPDSRGLEHAHDAQPVPASSRTALWPGAQTGTR